MKKITNAEYYGIEGEVIESSEMENYLIDLLGISALKEKMLWGTISDYIDWNSVIYDLVLSGEVVYGDSEKEVKRLMKE